MSDSLRERILLALIHSTPNEYLPPPNAMSTQVDAVIAALPELTEPVSVEAIGDYQYVCHPCGSSFSFYSSSTIAKACDSGCVWQPQPLRGHDTVSAGTTEKD